MHAQEGSNVQPLSSSQVIWIASRDLLAAMRGVVVELRQRPAPSCDKSTKFDVSEDDIGMRLVQRDGDVADVRSISGS